VSKLQKSGGLRGYHAGKKLKGRTRHILTDTQGFLVHAIVHSADIQGAAGAPDLLASIRYSFPWLRHVFADGGYAGDKLRKALTKIGQWKIEIIKRSERVKGFVVLPRRWVVERTFAWLNRNRRLAKDFENSIASAGRLALHGLRPTPCQTHRKIMISCRIIMSQALRCWRSTHLKPLHFL
jgi:transposase